ncbi:hypothetical protein AB0T83_00790 [Fluviibacterium sp. DFM31]|uniref:Sulfotransferase family protein n=1 Tax=Meridianimarinicoccus marinus TaxID=3231483 RepID=A0ABV3L180_9RHOB
MTGLIVAGFHRSGTSSVAQQLANCGLSLGEDLIGANEFNRFGHFESWPVVRFHDGILARKDADWARIPDGPIAFTPDEAQWVRDYCAARDAKEPVWAVKDPRMCRFMRQWRAEVPGLKFLIVYRHPVATSQSLNRRSALWMARSHNTDNIARRFYHDPDLALKLWIEHNQHLLDLLAAYPDDCVVLGHHHILAGINPLQVAEDGLGLSLGADTATTTIDHTALSKKDPVLPVCDSSLIAPVLEIWQRLEDADWATAQGHPREDIASALVHDPSGLKTRAGMADVQLSEIYKSPAGDISVQKGAKAVAAKISKPPFSLYFMRKKKYRDFVEKVTDW